MLPWCSALESDRQSGHAHAADYTKNVTIRCDVAHIKLHVQAPAVSSISLPKFGSSSLRRQRYQG